MSKSNDLGTAYGISKRKKMAKGGPVSAKTEKRPNPDQASEGESRNSGDKAPSQDKATSTPERRQSMRGPKTTPIKHPTMKQSPVFKTKIRDQEDDLQESAQTNQGPQEEPPTSDNEMRPDRSGPMVKHMKMMAEGGEIDGSDEQEMDHHDSIAAAIMARRDRLHDEVDAGHHDVDAAMALGGEVDIDMNGEEQTNDFDSRNEAALKENYDSDMDGISEPSDSAEMGDERESSEENQDDMVDSIRRKVVSKRQFKGR